MESAALNILVQGGLTSVALASLWINYKISSNHINHNTDALKDLTSTLSELKEVINDK